MSRSPARWWLALASAALVLVGLGAAANGTLTYSRTPGDLLVNRTPVGERVRVEGTVVPGTVAQDAGSTTFVLEGGGARTTVRSTGVPSGTFRPGGDAVVEGVVGAGGVLEVDRVMAKHSNTYRAVERDTGNGGTGPTP